MDELYCKYPSKPCLNLRSVKTNGQFHTLCDHHRARANDAQRRWHTRKRLIGDNAEPLDTNQPSPSDTSDLSDSDPAQQNKRSNQRGPESTRRSKKAGLGGSPFIRKRRGLVLEITRRVVAPQRPSVPHSNHMSDVPRFVSVGTQTPSERAPHEDACAVDDNELLFSDSLSDYLDQLWMESEPTLELHMPSVLEC